MPLKTCTPSLTRPWTLPVAVSTIVMGRFLLTVPSSRQLLDLVLGHVAVAAEELHGLERDLDRRVRGVELHGRRLGQAGLTPVGQDLDVAEQQVLDVEAGHLHAGQLLLDELELGDGATELDPALGVVDAELEAALDDAEGHGGHARSLDGERGLGLVPAATDDLLGLTQEPVLADAHV